MGKTFVEYQLDTISRFKHDIFLVANSIQQVQIYIDKIDVKKIMGFIIDDEEIIQVKDLRSPLIGLYSAFKELDNLKYEKALVLPCDIPLVKFEVIDFLIQNCRDFECCIPKWKNNLLEPLLAIYPVNKAYKTSKKNIVSNQYKLTKIINPQWKTKFVSIEGDIKRLDSDLLSFKNINMLKEIKLLESSLNKSH